MTVIKIPITLIKHAYKSPIATPTAIHFIGSNVRGAGLKNKKGKERKIPYEYYDTFKIIQIFITFQVTTLVLAVGTVL